MIDRVTELVERVGFEGASAVIAAESVTNLDYVYLAGNLYLQHIESRSMDQRELLEKYKYRFTEDTHKFMTDNYDVLESMIDRTRSRGYKYSSIKDLASNYLMRDGDNVLEDVQWMWMRVAVQVAYPDMQDVKSTYDGLSKGEFVHATPTCVNACLKSNNTNRSQQESCFLIPVGDDMNSIADAQKMFLMGSKNNGGFGSDVSRIRHSQVAGRGKTKGIPGLLQIWNTLVPYADQLGSRPGACTIFFSAQHIDAPVVIKMKDKNSSVQATNLNYAIVIPDLFMRRVEEGGKWSLFCPRKEKKLWVRLHGGDDRDSLLVDSAPCLHDLYGSDFDNFYQQCEEAGIADDVVDARSFYDSINTARCTFGAPFIMFKDNVNRKSNHQHIGTVGQSNLCVRGDTVILIDEGHLPIKELAERREDVRVWNGEEWSTVRPMKTGENQHLLTVSFSNGSELHCTDYHRFAIVGTKGKHTIKQASDLKVGDKILKCDFPVVKRYDETEDEEFRDIAYTHGFFCGDGTYSNRKPYIRLYGEKEKLAKYIITRDEPVLEEGVQRRLRCKLPVDIPQKFNVPLHSSIETKLKWLAGYLDADGSVSKTGGYHSIQAVSIEKKFLDDIKMLLQTLGCNSKYSIHSKGGKQSMPMNDGTGRYKEYDTKVSWRMVISTKDLITLHGLGLDTKRLVYSVPQSLVQKDSSRFVTVTSILDEGEYADTYCFTEPKRNMGIFNGVLTSQCMEILQYTTPPTPSSYLTTKMTELTRMLREHGAGASCDLATLNLPKFLVNGDIDWKRIGETTRLITRNLNRVLDRTSGILPNEGQRLADLDHSNPLSKYVERDPAHTGRMTHRAIGIGAMGYASLLSLLELEYGSEKAQEIGVVARACLYWHSIDESCRLAERDGPCKSWEGSPLSRGILHHDMYMQECRDTGRKMFKEIHPSSFDVEENWDYLRHRCMKGTRNSLTTCQMPNSTTSSVLGVSPGFEPFFDILYSSSNVNGASMNVYDSFIEVMKRHNLYDPQLLAIYLRENRGSIDNIGDIFPHLSLETINHIKSVFRNGFSVNKLKMLRFYQRMGVYVDMAQSTNIFYAKPNAEYLGTLTTLAWRDGCKTLYYLHRKTTDKISLQSTKVVKKVEEEPDVCPIDCRSCQ